MKQEWEAAQAECQARHVLRVVQGFAGPQDVCAADALPWPCPTRHLLDVLAAAEEENQCLRKFLWLNHGHMARLYGDDGEMQCAPFDFKRDPVEQLVEHVVETQRAERDQLQARLAAVERERDGAKREEGQ